MKTDQRINRRNHRSTSQSTKVRQRGSSLLNTAINKLPFELHLPGYQWCGPGTRIEKRLERGDLGINKLDSACKEHDLAYLENKDLTRRHVADKILEEKAKERFFAKDSTLGEKVSSAIVNMGMKIKRKSGMGLKKLPFDRTVTIKPKKSIKKTNLIDKASKVALRAAKVKKPEISSKTKKTRVLEVPQSGGFIPLIPLFAGLSAIGAVAGGAAGIAKAVNDAKSAQKELTETKRHNEAMEAIASSQSGTGLYLKPYKKGYGLFVGSKN